MCVCRCATITTTTTTRCSCFAFRLVHSFLPSQLSQFPLQSLSLLFFLSTRHNRRLLDTQATHLLNPFCFVCVCYVHAWVCTRVRLFPFIHRFVSHRPQSSRILRTTPKYTYVCVHTTSRMMPIRTLLITHFRYTQGFCWWETSFRVICLSSVCVCVFSWIHSNHFSSAFLFLSASSTAIFLSSFCINNNYYFSFTIDIIALNIIFVWFSIYLKIHLHTSTF